MVRLLFNPAAGGVRRADRLQTLVAGRDVELVAPASAAELILEARRAAEAGAERLLVAGGDGTLHQAMQGLAGTDCALGIIPLGTGNDLVRSLGLELDPIRALERALDGAVRRIDLGKVGDRVFAGVAACGFVGAVLEFIESGSPKRGPWVYPYAVIRTLGAYRSPEVDVVAGEDRFRGPALMVAVANSSTFGGGMRIAPEARLDDGQLDLIIVRDLPRWRLLTLFPRVYRGTHTSHSGVEVQRAAAVTLRCDRELTLYGDGEPLALTSDAEIRIESWPGALAVAG